jgi:hypothetical protein
MAAGRSSHYRSTQVHISSPTSDSSNSVAKIHSAVVVSANQQSRRECEVPKAPEPQFSDEFIEIQERNHHRMGYAINVVLILSLCCAALSLFA